MKKISMAILLSFFIIGCSVDVKFSEIQEVERFCSKNGGLKELEVSVSLFPVIDKIRCKDNALYYVAKASFAQYTSNGHNYDIRKSKHFNRKYRYIIED